jgi:pyrroline-5-carboxylate reductase
MAFKGMVGFVGAGKMGGALIEGIIGSGLLDADSISVFDADAARMEELSKRLKVKAAGTAREAVERSDAVFICVKPDQFGAVAGEIKAGWNARKPAVVSVMAGVRAARISEALGASVSVARAMPNVACLIRRGVSGVALDPNAPQAVNDFVFNVFEALGGAVKVAETKLDAVTALSGSGPAYVFMFIEALADAGVKMGLDRAVSEKLAVLTVAGAAAMAEQPGANTLQLRASVSSPGGTTVAATAALERAGFRGVVIDAVEKAKERAVELGS